MIHHPVPARVLARPPSRALRMPRVRVLVRRLHLWLGMGVGLLFVLLGITGSALVFHLALDTALHPAIRTEAAAPGPDWSSPVWDRALTTARASGRSPQGKWSFEVTGEAGPIPARFYPPSHLSHHGAPREMVWFSADGTRVLRAEPWGSYLMSWLYELHMQLLAGDRGRQLVGWSGVAMLVLLATGILAWWPRGSWRKAAAFKRDAAPIRRLHDLHKLFGLWSAPLLLLLVATGVLLALPPVKAALIAPDAPPDPVSVAAAGPQIPVAQALTAAHHALPDARLAFIDVPGTADGSFRVRLQVPGDPHRRFPASFVFIDQYSGGVLAVRDVRRGSGGSQVASWIRALHDGSVGGLAGRALAFLLGLVPAALFATGFLHWRRRTATPTSSDCARSAA